LTSALVLSFLDGFLTFLSIFAQTLTIKSLHQEAIVSVNGVRINSPEPIVAGDIITIGTKLMLRITLVDPLARGANGEKSGSADGSVNKSKESGGSEMSGPLAPSAAAAGASTRELRSRSPTKKSFMQRLEEEAKAASDDSAKDSMSIFSSPRGSSPTRGPSAAMPLEASVLPETSESMPPPRSPPRSPRRSPPRSPARSPPRSPQRVQSLTDMMSVDLPRPEQDEQADVALGVLADMLASSQEASSVYSSPPPSSNEQQTVYFSRRRSSRRGRPMGTIKNDGRGKYSRQDDSGADDEMDEVQFTALPRGAMPSIQSEGEVEIEEEWEGKQDDLGKYTDYDDKGNRTHRPSPLPRGRPKKTKLEMEDSQNHVPRYIKALELNYRYSVPEEKERRPRRVNERYYDTDSPTDTAAFEARLPAKRGRKRGSTVAALKEESKPKRQKVSDSKPKVKKPRPRVPTAKSIEESAPPAAIAPAPALLPSNDLGVSLADWITAAIPPGMAITKEQLGIMVGMKVADAINACVNSGVLLDQGGALQVAPKPATPTPIGPNPTNT
jgi:hypothetical protein